MKIFITGIGGFIGFHVAKKLQEENACEIVGMDNLNSYYSPQLKIDRLAELGFDKQQLTNHLSSKNKTGKIVFYKDSIENKENVFKLFKEFQFDIIVHLAAQAGVRHSLKNPYSYIDSNINGFMTILEACRQYPVKHLVFASSSSIYGLNQKIPYSEKDGTDHPASLYAATKKANEMMAHSYSYLFNIPCTGLRFFSVYGPWGRPDMAYFSFTEKILKGEPIDVYNHGKMKRDFTFIDEIVNGIVKILSLPPSRNENWKDIDDNPDTSVAPFRILNIGNNTSVPLEEFITELENAIGKKAIKNYLPMHPGDVIETYADTSRLTALTGFKPVTPVREGLKTFALWYKKYFNIS